MGLVYNATTRKVEYLIELDGGSGSGSEPIIINLTYMQDTAPNNPQEKDVWFNTTDNKIYTYKNGQWTDPKDPQVGVFYLYNDEYYLWDGNSLEKTDLNIYEKIENKTDDYTESSSIKYPSSKALSDGLKSVEPNLYDIKTLSQAITEKGWACLSKEGNFLSQAQAPTLYNSLVEKLGSAEQEPTFTSISGIQTAERLEPRDIVFYNGWYYYVQNGKNAIKRTQDWITTETVVTGNFDYQNMILCGDNLVFVKNQKFLVYNITRNELSSVIDTVLYVGSEDFSTIDNVLYFGTRDGFGYISFDDLDDFENLSNNLHINTTTTRPSFKCGNIWYGVTYGGSFKKGNSFDSITESVNTVERPSCNVKIDDYYLVFGGSGQDGNHNTYKIEEDGTITKMRENNLSYPQAIKVVYYKGILFEADSYVSHYSTDLGISWTEIPEEEVGIYATVVLANGFCAYIDRYGSITQVETTAKEYTDTFVINGNTVTIDYAKAQDGTKIVTDFSQITPIQTIGNYLGYSNYFFLSQATGYEGVTLPYNSNLWTWMFVGDNYEETNVPTGNATRLLPQAENINVTGAKPTITISANKTYSFDTAITSLTISDVEVSDLETMLYFTTGGEIAFTDNSSLKWGGGSVPSLDINTTYCIAIKNGLAEIDKFGR